MNNFDQPTERRSVNNAVGVNSFFARVYGWMGASILISALVAFFVIQNGISMSGGSAIVLMIVWAVIPFFVQGAAMRSAGLGLALLFVYSALTGFVFSNILMVYTNTSIVAAFVSSASLFVTMSVYGFLTKKSLAKMGTILTAALIAIIIASLINIFLHVGMLSLIISIVSVVIFTGLTAYDTQMLKQFYNQNGDSSSATGIAIGGALMLYLNFINLFLSLLQIFGAGNNRN
ncbi:Bax inhibitor-1/YccA family protein [Lactobacillus sp. Sy-1]|uniref:Bax inhibitor-1/YccA family protein n=1 Tax=Lactobacillus sp. Sy-1 TaxID=2109645 RepID=UPI001C5904FB|nr:Bax inhibitor-1/YccA family protein [Lactobacillus sp. Sy-1]MBW1605705.1 Bax inhibitor-1/YccA family protein [Lactobacillus sp. Sy-1]